ncbi:Hypothetical Protein FCC1311_107962 [Hondaea fermentalgiana]|uniref:DUF4203 domain-containing protein n=1 Tax=Hondaea fermentalgiana TaxID=2315210 RepID=A0A2R5GVI3_9STRA|nr:Hypothetical Protein FCC1311_107962 [Hondaea fermentalgiana]|eukprot:GBG34575.1 Hypothetical Protein FCC1311_107962 [Hondaea fermentalgiana]
MGVLQTAWEGPVARLMLSVVMGALMGLILSFVINCTLVEISLNAVFSFYFGFLFLLIGGLIIFRVSSHMQLGRRVLLYMFGVSIVSSGILCLLFKETWIFTLPRGLKAIVYGTLGAACSFAVTFSTLDLLNFFWALCMDSNTQGLIQSVQQVDLIMGTSLVLGLSFGLFFALFDVGKFAHSASDLRHELLHEEMFSVPLGIMAGSLAAAANETLRSRHEISRSDYKYSPLFSDDNDDDLI